MRYFTSDHHFFHNKVIQFENRPFNNLEEMHDNFINYWNKTITPKDIVYYLGDFSFGKIAQTRGIINCLNGRVIFIKGNHDHESDGMYLDAGFSSIAEQMIISLAKDIKVKLCHYPYVSADADSPPRYADRRPSKEDYWLLHGHSHSKFGIRPEVKSISVCWDYWKRFLNENEIVSIIRKSNAVLN